MSSIRKRTESIEHVDMNISSDSNPDSAACMDASDLSAESGCDMDVDDYSSEYSDMTDEFTVSDGPKIDEQAVVMQTPDNEDLLQQTGVDLTTQDMLMLDSFVDTQADNLLEQVSVTIPSSVRDLLLHIKSVLESASSVSPMSHTDAITHLNNLNVVWPWTIDLGKERVNYKFAYLPPDRIDVVGSLLVGGEKLGTLIKRRSSGYHIDVAVEMPASMFQSKDHLNYRYFHKRSFYLAQLATILAGALPAHTRLDFAYDRHDVRKPIMTISLPLGPKPSSPSAYIHIRPCISNTIFRLDRLAPNRNSVRPASESLENVDQLPPTPAYNSQVLADMYMLEHLRFQHHAVTQAPYLAAGIKLLKVWCEKKDLTRWAFPISYLACSLIMLKKIGCDLKPMQLYRAVVFYVANINWSAPVIMCAGSDTVVQEWKGVAGVGLVDAHGVNLAWWAGIADAKLLQMEARKAAELAALGEFVALFLSRPSAPISTYDHIVQIPIPNNPPAFYNPNVRLDDPSLASYLTRAIPRLLARALTNRIKLVSYIADDINSTVSHEWNIGKNAPKLALMDKDKISIGLFLCSEEADRSIDIGPSPETDPQGCAEFRKVWGSMSELRRFPDGSICESVSWASTTPSRIVSAIIDHVVSRHMNVRPLYHWNDHSALKRLRAVANTISADHCPPLGIDETFTSLAQLISSIDHEKIPLPVVAVFPVSSELTRTAVACHRAAATFVVEFEASGKWPDDAEARYHMIVLFLIVFAEELEALKKRNIKCTLVKQPLSMDILYGGYLFKMIVKPKAQNLLNAEINHAMDIANLTRVFAKFGPSARLFKYFIARHLLGYQLHDHITELIVAHIFSGNVSMPYTKPPADAMCAFVRVLELIVSHDWVHHTLPVLTRVGTPVRSKSDMLSGDVGPHHSMDLDTSVVKSQAPIDTAAPATGNAIVASAYARYTIELVIVKRLRSICKAALAHLIPSLVRSPCQLPAQQSCMLDPLLVSPTDIFDIVVQIKPSIVNQYIIRGACLPTAKHPAFNPVDDWINQVVQAYGSLLRVFFNDIDGSLAGMILNPMVLVPRRFTTSEEMMKMNPRIVGWTSPVDEESSVLVADNGDSVTSLMMTPNVGAIASDIARFGQGIIQSVIVQRPELL